MAGRAGRAWGVFAPLYALRSERDWGVGDLADLEALLGWVTGQGGTVVATLPLLASFLGRPFEPAPYRPVSRLFWNEFYLAVDRIPEWERCMPARELWGSGGVQARLRRLRAEAMVDYREVMALKRSVLEELARCFFESRDPGRDEGSRGLQTCPSLMRRSMQASGLGRRPSAGIGEPGRCHRPPGGREHPLSGSPQRTTISIASGRWSNN